ncbi:MAG: hypothetical protein ACRCSP_02000, partial [Rhodoglobus sp.]
MAHLAAGEISEAALDSRGPPVRTSLRREQLPPPQGNYSRRPGHNSRQRSSADLGRARACVAQPRLGLWMLRLELQKTLDF